MLSLTAQGIPENRELQLPYIRVLGRHVNNRKCQKFFGLRTVHQAYCVKLVLVIYDIYVGLTIFLELEGKIVDGTANDHLDELETCDDHSHDLGNSHSGGKWIVILAHVLSAHRMALRAK